MASEQQLAKLTIVVFPDLSGRQRPSVPGFEHGRLEVLFNPTEYSIERGTEFAEVAVPGLDSPVLQYVRGTGDKLSFELFLDATDTMRDGLAPSGQSVRERFVRPLEQLVLQHPELHAPPPISILWGSEVVIDTGVVTALSVKYTLFDVGGAPVRATATLSVREHRSAATQIAERRLESPDKANVTVVREGDTLPAIAFREYGSASLWRSIADANRITVPLDLRPGQVLQVPKLL